VWAARQTAGSVVVETVVGERHRKAFKLKEKMHNLALPNNNFQDTTSKFVIPAD
jgi:hypothetical protein